MAGWRIGFCCGNRQMIQALATIKGYYDYGMFQAVQIAAIMALRQGDAGIEHQAADLPEPPRRACAKASPASAGR